MKRLILLIGAVICVSTAATAQKVTINSESLLKKITKSDEAIANPKKAEDLSTWLDRAKLFYTAEIEVSKNFYEGMPEATVQLMFGKPATKKQVEIGNEKYNLRTYPPYVTAYFTTDGQLYAWELTPIYEGAFDKAVEAYVKAYALDVKHKKTKQIGEGLVALYNELYKDATVEYNLAHYDRAGELFAKTYELGTMEGITPQEDIVLGGVARNAGLAYLLGAVHYDLAKQYFEEAVARGYEDEGNLYYLDYYAYRGEADKLAEGDAAKETIFRDAKTMLETGLSKYPSNDKIIECLTDVYVSLNEDPNQIITVVKAAVEKNPENASLWYGLARIYDSQKDWDNAIDALQHMSALQPNNAGILYSIGLCYIHKADEIFIEANAKTYPSQKEYDAAIGKSYIVYAEAVPVLERAYTITPTDRSTVEMLKALTFRLRDQDGMMAKYTKYSEILNAMQ